SVLLYEKLTVLLYENLPVQSYLLHRTNDFLIYLYFLWYLFDQIPKTQADPVGTRTESAGDDATGTAGTRTGRHTAPILQAVGEVKTDL
ncbi:MAG: hypothetical protein J5543_02845, partial [Bacteroidales bacterium]|nr:hypothetical protein [Bacteroidales bacterium]